MLKNYGTRLQVREYETIHIGPRWDVESRSISEHQANAIDQYQSRTGQNLFEISRHWLKATNWVGSLGIGHYCIDVVPKIDTPDGESTVGAAMENLLYMLRVAGLLRVSHADISQLANLDKPLITAFLELYVKKLAFEWQRGPIRQYVRIEGNRQYLRGKLMFPEQMRMNSIHQERFYTASDEFSMDNPFSRILKAALRVCETQLFSFDVSLRARELRPLFDDVSDVYPTPEILRNIKLDRTMQRFEPLINLAREILERVSPSVGIPSEPVYSLMFNMWEVFESFIVAEFQQAMLGSGYIVRKQVTGKSLLLRSGTPEFSLRPDIGIFDRSTIICLIDTKWKRLDLMKGHDNVLEADMYQMYAYGKEYDSPTVVLLYPRFGALPEEVADYSHNNEEFDRKILVRTIDISRPLGKQSEWELLHQALRRVVMGDAAMPIEPN